MTTRLTEEQVMIQDMAKRFASDRLAPHTSAWAADKHFPVDVIRDTADPQYGELDDRPLWQ